jgi:trehalose 6-phosphate synthase
LYVEVIVSTQTLLCLCSGVTASTHHPNVQRQVNTDLCDAFHKPPHQWQSMWQMYNKVNLELVTELVEVFNDNDYVWIIDTELLMVPAFVGTRCKTANVAFVFNTPFPSSDIFRMLPARKDILRSLLNSDMIMFHCFTYARHFLTCCSRLLGLEYHAMRGGLLQLLFRGRHVHIRASHVGMDTKTFLHQLRRDPTVEAHKLAWREKLGGRQHVILGYDDLEPMSGMLLLLEGIKSLVRLFPAVVGKVVLVLVAVPLLDAHKQPLYADYQRRVRQVLRPLTLNPQPSTL